MKKRHIILILLYIFYVLVRLNISLQSPHFDTSQSYYILRQVEHIAQTGTPIIEDALSAGGRTFVIMPLYYYLLAGVYTIFSSVLAIKIVNNLLAGTIIFAVYLLCTQVIQNRRLSLLVTFLSATIPLYLSHTLNSISVFVLLFPGIYFMIYLFIRLRRDKSMVNYLLLLCLVLVLSTPAVFLLLLGFIIYLIICYVEDIDIPKIYFEFLIFMLFFFLWTNFIIYKNALLAHGVSIIWGNAPTSILARYLADINVIEAVTSVGILPLIFGMYTGFRYFFRVKNKNIYLFLSLFIATFIVFMARLINAPLGLVFMGGTLTILFGRFLRDFLSMLKKTKIAQYRNHIAVALSIIVIASQSVPGVIVLLNEETPDPAYFASFSWLQDTPADSVVVAPPEEGHYITYFGKRSNVLDTEYLLIQDADVRAQDIRTVYTSRFKIDAIRVLEKYDAEYIFFSNVAADIYGVDELAYVDDECFTQIYNRQGVIIYKWERQVCEIRSTN